MLEAKERPAKFRVRLAESLAHQYRLCYPSNVRPSRINQSRTAAAIMATELTVQSERAFQKQPHIFVNQKSKRTKSTKVGKGGRRWYKDVGLGFRTPKTAIEGSYIGMHYEAVEIPLETAFLETAYGLESRKG